MGTDIPVHSGQSTGTSYQYELLTYEQRKQRAIDYVTSKYPTKFQTAESQGVLEWLWVHMDFQNSGNNLAYIARYEAKQTNGMDLTTLKYIYAAFKRSEQFDMLSEYLMDKVTTLADDPSHGEMFRTIAEATSIAALLQLRRVLASRKQEAVRRARIAGLELRLNDLLKGRSQPNEAFFTECVIAENREFDTPAKIRSTLIDLMADRLTKQSITNAFIHRKVLTEPVYEDELVVIEVRERRSRAEQKVQLDLLRARRNNPNPSTSDNQKVYWRDWRFYDHILLENHQVIKLERQRRTKRIQFRVCLGEDWEDEYCNEICEKFFQVIGENPSTKTMALMYEAAGLAWKQTVKKQVSDAVWWEKLFAAHEEMAEVFGVNLGCALMQKDLGEMCVGIDPGFTGGCALILIDVNGAEVPGSFHLVYPKPKSPEEEHPTFREAMETIRTLALQLCHQKHGSIDSADGFEKFKLRICIGNGTGCGWAQEQCTLINKEGFMAPFDYNPKTKETKANLILSSESGSSQYSISDAAHEEFGGNRTPDARELKRRSALTIARRQQSPLYELVKYDYELISAMGFGLYQKELPKRMLRDTFLQTYNGVVSNKGADVNTAPRNILKLIVEVGNFLPQCRFVCGLSEQLVDRIIERRNVQPFISRQELRSVEGIDDRVFTECAGFLTINAETAGRRYQQQPDSTNVLDSTTVHPDCYALAERLLDHVGMYACDVIDRRDELQSKFQEKSSESWEFLIGVTEEEKGRLSQVITALTTFEHRTFFDKRIGPALHLRIRKLSELYEGMEMEGVVRSTTPIGAFVDIGLTKPVLLSIGKFSIRADDPMKPLWHYMDLTPNQRVLIRVLKVNNHVDTHMIGYNDWDEHTVASRRREDADYITHVSVGLLAAYDSEMRSIPPSYRKNHGLAPYERQQRSDQHRFRLQRNYWRNENDYLNMNDDEDLNWEQLLDFSDE